MNNNTENKRKRLDRMKTILSKKRKVFNSLRKDTNITNNTTSKFVTQIVRFNEQKQDNNANSNEFTNYGFGARFYYHPYYKNKQLFSEQIPDAPTGWIDGGNNFISNHTHTFAAWFVSPIYESIKAEVLNSKNIRISLIEYKNTIGKATMKLNALKHIIPCSRPEFETLYCIKRGSPITV
eukprot:28369_1